jgi:hypothetical protein
VAAGRRRAHADDEAQAQADRDQYAERIDALYAERRQEDTLAAL